MTAPVHGGADRRDGAARDRSRSRRRSPARPSRVVRRPRAGAWSSSDRAVRTVWKPRCLAARAACLAGCAATSNVEAGRRFGLPVAGTMAHSWVMAFDDEIEAFRAYMGLFGERSTLLIDTYDTMKPRRRRSWRPGLRPSAVRLDSGDLGALAERCARSSTPADCRATRIIVSGDLDEHRMAALVADGAPIDAFGVGTSISAVERRAGARRRLQAGGDRARRRGRADGEAEHGQAHVSGPQAGVASRVGHGRARRRDRARATSRGGGRPLLSCVMRQGKRLAPPHPVDASMTSRAARRRAPGAARRRDVDVARCALTGAPSAPRSTRSRGDAVSARVARSRARRRRRSDRSRPSADAADLLPRHARRPAFHHPLDLGQRHHAGVAGRRHGERAVGGAALDGPLRALAGEQPVDRPEANESPPPTRSQISRPSRVGAW